MFSTKLKKLREQRGITQTELAALLNAPQQSVSNWETGRVTPNTGTMCQLCDFFGVTMDYLFRDGEMAATKIPILQTIYHGMDIASTPAEPVFEEIPVAMAENGQYFGFRLRADSLSPRFMPGDVAIFKLQETFENMDIIAAQLNKELVIRQAVIQNDAIVLSAFNPHPAWYPRVYTLKEFMENPDINVIGVLVEVRARSFK